MITGMWWKIAVTMATIVITRAGTGAGQGKTRLEGGANTNTTDTTVDTSDHSATVTSASEILEESSYYTSAVDQNLKTHQSTNSMLSTFSSFSSTPTNKLKTSTTETITDTLQAITTSKTVATGVDPIISDEQYSTETSNSITTTTTSLPDASNNDTSTNKYPHRTFASTVEASSASPRRGARGGGHAAIIEGDVILGGLMTVRVDGRVEQRGVQAVEAALWSVEAAGRWGEWGERGGGRLGALLLDDNGNDAHGLEMALEFIKGSISNIDDSEFACNVSNVRKVISGVIGAASSATSLQVANLLRLFKIPQVSYYATSPELSNKARFEYFTRTIPSDHYQVHAMVEIMKQFGWKYISIIYEDTVDGIKAFEELETILEKNSMCIAVKEKLTKDMGEDEHAYDAIIARLQTRARARGIVVWVSAAAAWRVMAALSRAGAAVTQGPPGEATLGPDSGAAAGALGGAALGAPLWLGAAQWAGLPPPPAVTVALEGAVALQLDVKHIPGFQEYFLSLTPENNQRNPWFIEFWEQHFKCSYRGRSASRPSCTGKERLTRDDVTFDPLLHFIADAVFAFAHALRFVPGGGTTPPAGPELLRALRRVSFTGLSGDQFHFDSNGDGPARYSILHFKQVQLGEYKWIKVGHYLDGELNLSLSEIVFKRESPAIPVSVCSVECGSGQAAQRVEGEACCVQCVPCEAGAVVAAGRCQRCGGAARPDATRRRCVPLPARRAPPPAAGIAAAIAALGLLTTLVVWGVWWWGCGRYSSESAWWCGALGGAALCWAAAGGLLVPAGGPAGCAAQRAALALAAGSLPAPLLAALQLRRAAPGLPALPRAALLLLPQLLLLLLWQARSAPRAVSHFPSRDIHLLVCDFFLDLSLLPALLYPAALIVTCTVLAIRTRNLPDPHNEYKHIGLTMYSLCVIWVLFVPLYCGLAAHVPLRVLSLSASLALSAAVTQGCLFAPKMYMLATRGRAGLGAARGAVSAAALCAATAGAGGPRVGGTGGPRGSTGGPTAGGWLSSGPPASGAPTRRHCAAQTSPPLPLDARALLQLPAHPPLPPFTKLKDT